jgi:hypothetical protein
MAARRMGRGVCLDTPPSPQRGATSPFLQNGERLKNQSFWMTAEPGGFARPTGRRPVRPNRLPYRQASKYA